MWSLKFQEWNAKCFNQHRLPHPQYMEVRIGDGVLRDDTPETSRPILASRPVSCFLTFHPKPAESPEKAMAPHSGTLAWKIPWTEEPGGLQSMGSGRVGHGWATSLSLFTFVHWRRKWQPTPVFLPGESQGWGAWWAAVYGVATESDMTEVT